jgi:hypothetical protein
VPVAGFGLQLRGAAAELGQVGQPAVAQLVQGVADAVRIVGDRGLLEQVLGAGVGQPAPAGLGAMSPIAGARRPAAEARRAGGRWGR